MLKYYIGYIAGYSDRMRTTVILSYNTGQNPTLQWRCKLWIAYMITYSSDRSGWEVGVSGLGC